VRSSAAIDMTMTAGVAEGAEKLIASAERHGGIMLAELSQAELCALRAETLSLVCERTTRWWVRLGTGKRRELGQLALELMAIRGVLRLPPGASAIDMYEAGQLSNEHLAPQLAIILAARTSPRPLVSCQVPGMDELNWCHPRFFGITTAGHRLRVLVCEVLTEHPAGLQGQPALGTILRYTLITPERTAKMIASWARAVAAGRQPGSLPAVTLLAHGDGQGTLDQERFQIEPGHGIFVVTRSGPDGRADPPVMLDEAGTIMELASALSRMAL
jgi:hypothetical protein